MGLNNKSTITLIAEIDPNLMALITESKKFACLEHESNEETIMRVVSMQLQSGDDRQWAETVFEENSERPDLDREDCIGRLIKVSDLIVNGFNLRFLKLIDDMRISKISVSNSKLELEIVRGRYLDIPEDLAHGTGD